MRGAKEEADAFGVFPRVSRQHNGTRGSLRDGQGCRVPHQRVFERSARSSSVVVETIFRDIYGHLTKGRSGRSGHVGMIDYGNGSDSREKQARKTLLNCVCVCVCPMNIGVYSYSKILN